MTALTCPRCGAPQPEDEVSFSCRSCGADLVSGREEAPAGRGGGGLLPGRRRRVAFALAAALAALGLVVAARFCVDRTDEEHGRAFAERTLGDERIEPPTPRNELPPARAAGLADLAVTDTAAPVPGAGTIRGRLTWARVRPPPAFPFLSGDRDCGVTVTIPSVPLGAEGGVAEALVVAIPEDVEVAAARPRAEPLHATIRACLPEPRLLAGPPGTPVELRTVGLAAHELVPSAPLPGFPARLEAGAVLRTRLPDSGTVHLTDPAHPWERVTLVAVPTSLAATVNAEGFFRFAEVPPGKVTLRFYTEATGPFDRVVHLAPSGDAMVDVDLADEVPGFGPVPPGR